MSTAKPSYFLMLKQYEKYLVDSKPCKYGYTNQCAVRLSLALSNCGMTYERFGEVSSEKRIHQGREKCQLEDVPHIVGADELHLYLRLVWDTGIEGKGNEIKDKITFLRGIVYFNNCFKRKKTDTSMQGDHIDLWTGTKYYNQVIHVGAGGDAGAKADLFSRADYVRFFWLPE